MTKSRAGVDSRPASSRCCAPPDDAAHHTEYLMSWLEGTRARARLLFARRAAESRMDEEIRLHIDMETERLIRDAGLDPHEARRRAFVAFGGVENHKEALRSDRGLAWLSGTSLDLKL